jgi:hypothetical protein
MGWKVAVYTYPWSIVYDIHGKRAASSGDNYTLSKSESGTSQLCLYDMCLSANLILPSILLLIHRNQTISRIGANIISRRPSHGQFARRCCHQAFLRIFSEVTYIQTVGNSTLLKIYTLSNHTITIGVCILETQLLGLLYGGGASFVQKWSMPWMSANI